MYKLYDGENTMCCLTGQNNANENKLFSVTETSHTGALVTSLKAQNVLHVNDGRVSASLTQVVFVRASLILLRPGPWDEWQEAGVVKRRIPYGRIQNPFFITQVKLKVKIKFIAVSLHICIRSFIHQCPYAETQFWP